MNALSIPIAVIMERSQIRRGRWSVPSWQAVAVVAGEHLAGEGHRRTLVRAGDDREQFLWTGLRLDLHRDGAESYRYNLVGEQPALFVICHESPDGELEPHLVTADYDAAAVGLEGDDQVFNVPIPPEVYQRLEQFVVQHYTPREGKKRKRKNWSETIGRG